MGRLARCIIERCQALRDDPTMTVASGSLHPFDTAMRLEPLGDGRYAGATSPDYANMVGPFGGTIAAVMLQAPSLAPDRIGDPAALTVNFCGPIADGAFEIVARAVRTNRSNQHWTMVLTQGADVLVTASAVFAKRRDTWGHTEAVAPDASDADVVGRASTALRPPWAQRYDMRFVRGPLPVFAEGAPGEEPTSLLWLADDPPRPLDWLSLAAISDAFFPRIFIRRPRFTPIGTVSLTLYFHADAALLTAQSSRPVLGHAWASHFGHGMFDEHAEVWSDDGRLLVSAHQIVYYKD